MINKTFEELKLTGQLPSPPGVGMKILELTKSEDFSADEIARTIMTDPALTGRLLKLANSAQSGAAEPITTVTEATIRLGIHSVVNIALGLSLVSAYRSGVCERFDYDRYWSMSLARAVAAQSISRHWDKGTGSDAYILGLLSEIGYLALASVYPTEYSSMLAVCGYHATVELTRAERERFEIDHSEVSAYLLEEWGLPQDYSQAVQMYEHPDRSTSPLEGRSRQMTRILRAARLISEVCLSDATTPAALWKRYASGLTKLRDDLAMTSESFETLYDAITQEWLQWASVLEVSIKHPIDIADVYARAASAEAVPSNANAAPAGVWSVQLARPTPGAAVASDSGLRVLAVDDDALSLRLLERHLAQSGHHVRCASDGAEALKIALETNPQVVIADWMMPKMDGVELCRTLRRIECGRDMFFLLLTGRDEEDRVVQAFDAGVDDYVVKPFNPKLLLARLKGGQRVIELKERVENDRKMLRKQAAELGLLNRKLQTAALTDVLTELPNRRYAIKRLQQDWEASSRTGKPMSVLMIDIDHFKHVNDVHGHDVGDIVLKEAGALLRATKRQGEEASRLGGEEFLVICSNTTAAQAAICGERIRAAFEARVIASPLAAIRITVSIGVAERDETMLGVDALLKAADAAVYAGKSAGRNQVMLAVDRRERSKSA